MSVDRINSAQARPLDPKVRMADLARLAGVSIATVSRSLNDSPLINRATKTRIWRIASAQGYLASDDIAGRPGAGRATVAVMLPADNRSRLNPLIPGLLAAARDLRCNLMISPLGRNAHDDLAGAVGLVPADAYIFFNDPALHGALHDLMADGETRFMVWGDATPGQGLPRFGADDLAGGAMATRCLAQRGCRRIAYLSAPDAPETAQRFMGYLTGLNGAGLPVDAALILTGLRPDLVFGRDFDGIFVADEALLGQAVRQVPDLHRIVAWSQGEAPVAVTTVGIDLAATARRLLTALLAPESLSSQIFAVQLNIV